MVSRSHVAVNAIDNKNHKLAYQWTVQATMLQEMTSSCGVLPVEKLLPELLEQSASHAYNCTWLACSNPWHARN